MLLLFCKFHNRTPRLQRNRISRCFGVLDSTAQNKNYVRPGFRPAFVFIVHHDSVRSHWTFDNQSLYGVANFLTWIIGELAIGDCQR